LKGDKILQECLPIQQQSLQKTLRLPENKNGTVFVNNGDGTFGVDMNKVNAILRPNIIPKSINTSQYKQCNL
jgi:hypothetical protein